MKKYLVPAIAVLAFLVGFVIFQISLGYEKVQYENTLSSNFSHVSEEGGELIAEYMSYNTQVIGQNLSKIKSSISVYNRKKLYSKPEYDAESAIYLTFSDGAKVIIAVNDSVSDGVFVNYNYKHKNLWMSIEKYKTMDWVSRAISPEGIYNENIIVE